jgi:hypothetical protein
MDTLYKKYKVINELGLTYVRFLSLGTQEAAAVATLSVTRACRNS